MLGSAPAARAAAATTVTVLPRLLQALAHLGGSAMEGRRRRRCLSRVTTHGDAHNLSNARQAAQSRLATILTTQEMMALPCRAQQVMRVRGRWLPMMTTPTPPHMTTPTLPPLLSTLATTALKTMKTRPAQAEAAQTRLLRPGPHARPFPPCSPALSPLHLQAPLRVLLRRILEGSRRPR